MSVSLLLNLCRALNNTSFVSLLITKELLDDNDKLLEFVSFTKSLFVKSKISEFFINSLYFSSFSMLSNLPLNIDTKSKSFTNVFVDLQVVILILLTKCFL